MCFQWVFVIITISCILASKGERHRIKRRIDEFAEMIVLTTDRNPMDFNGYGNYCGLGGHGDTVDDIDKCCKTHDHCYALLNRSNCESLLKYKVYTTEYKWSFKQGTIICNDTEHCEHALCECDRTAAICFAQHKAIYNEKHKHNTVFSGLLKLVGSKNKPYKILQK